MVYESDFYTTRRPYSSSRPYVSSYSVTPILQGPFYLYNPYATTTYLRTIPHMPYTAHKRLVSIVHSPVHIYHSGTYLPIKIHSRVRPSIIAAELNRIRYLTRPSNKSYTSEYLNSRDYIDFDDETREIRAKTDNLLRKIHVFVPRPSISNYDETSPERLRSDDYVRRIINAKNSRKDIESLPWYSTPEKHRDIGAGHLACIKYAGGRPQSKRRPYYTVGDLVPGDVKSDVKLMSYYMKNRKAAEDASPPSVQHSERAKEAQNAPASSVTWADEVVHEEELPEEEPVQQQQQQQLVEEEPMVEVEVELTAEVQLPKPKRKKEKKPVSENNDVEDMEAEYDVDGVKKQPDDETIKKVQEYLDKKAAEKKMEEERRAWELAEARRVAEELEIARLAKIKQEEDIRIAEIKEQERQEAEKQAIIERAEAARQEAERLVEDEKLYNEAVAQAIADEEERLFKEKEKEDQKKKQEDEEEKVVQLAATNGVASDGVVVDEHHSEEHSVHQDLSDQDNEAKPYEVDHDEDTQIEEDVHEEPEELENPFVDGEGASVPVEADEPVPETPKVRESGGAGGEQGFDWSEYDNEPEGEETGVEEQAPEVQEESSTAGEQQVFDECEVASQAEADEAQIEESRVTEEAQVEEVAKVEEEEEEEVAHEEEVAQQEEEEAQVTEETQEEVEETQETQVEEVEATEEVQIEEVEATEEEAKSEDKSVHDASEEEEDEEEEEEKE